MVVREAPAGRADCLNTPKRRIVFVSYRDWANRIVEALKEDGHEVLHVSTKAGLTRAAVDAFAPDLFFMAGWNWFVPAELYEEYLIIGLHPSLLPKYRGGSPIQNQIIAGERVGGVSLFQLTEKFDEGPLYGQEQMPLDGHLDEVLDRITSTGLKLFRKLVTDYPDLKPVLQDHSQATLVKRRTPEESELSAEKIASMTAGELYDFVRCLEDPYPNAFLRGKDGKKLLIKRAELEK